MAMVGQRSCYCSHSLHRAAQLEPASPQSDPPQGATLTQQGPFGPGMQAVTGVLLSTLTSSRSYPSPPLPLTSTVTVQRVPSQSIETVPPTPLQGPLPLEQFTLQSARAATPKNPSAAPVAMITNI